MATPPLPPHLEDFLTRQPHAYLSTASMRGEPHAVPIVFAYVGGLIYSPIDAKPKSVSPASVPRGEHWRHLKRLRNLRENPRAAFLVDRYDDDWSHLCYLLIHTEAAVLPLHDCADDAPSALRRKYGRYGDAAMLPDDAPVIRLTPLRYHAWGSFELAE